MLKHKNIPVVEFDTAQDFAAWLDKNLNLQSGVWLRFYKKASGIIKLNYASALEVALCYGWIDSIVNKFDDQSYVQKFTPRRPKSIWSQINKAKVAKLIKDGKMQPAGLAAIHEAKQNGMWDKAYASPSNMKAPDDFLQALQKNNRAFEFYKTLNKANMYAIAFRLQTAKKAETKQRWIVKIVQMLEKGEKFH